jgi:hypothetical protein
LMSLGQDRQPVHAPLVDDRHYGAKVSGMRIAVVGRGWGDVSRSPAR